MLPLSSKGKYLQIIYTEKHDAGAYVVLAEFNDGSLVASLPVWIVVDTYG